MGILVKNIGKSIGKPPTKILENISFSIKDHDFVALTGRSGSGKSTLLYLMSSLDTPSEGSIEIDEYNLQQLKGKQLHRFRNQKIGFIFQFHYLLAELSALENVLMPAHKAGEAHQKKDRALSLLEQFELGEKIHRLPRQLSGGEQQRVAIARALIMKPQYLFADEPTGSLDSVNSENVMKIIEELNIQEGMTIIMVTHEPLFAARAHRQIQLLDGKIKNPS